MTSTPAYIHEKEQVDRIQKTATEDNEMITIASIDKEISHRALSTNYIQGHLQNVKLLAGMASLQALTPVNYAQTSNDIR